MSVPHFELEAELGGRVAGLDEAGRGPLAGPVVAAAVLFAAPPPAALRDALDDSKKLSLARRERAFRLLRESAGVSIGVSAASVAEIDRINVLAASLLAMRRAFLRLARASGFAPDHALVDGSVEPALPCPVRTVVGGDGLSLSIAAASIVAKVTRDRLMARLDRRRPGYGWSRNAGYGTAAHMDAMRRLGLTPHHRLTFRPVALLAAAGAPG